MKFQEVMYKTSIDYDYNDIYALNLRNNLVVLLYKRVHSFGNSGYSSSDHKVP